MHGNDLTMRRVAKLLAWTFGAVACVMTATAGAGLGGDDSRAAMTLGIGFAAVSIGTAVLPYFIDAYWRAGNRATAGGLVAILTVFGFAEYGAHVMYTVGHRSMDTNKAIHQNAVYDGAQDSATEAKAQLAIFTARLDKLTAANPWAAETTPDSIRAEVASMEGDRVFKRSRQCSNVTLAASRAFCDRYAAAKANLAIIDEMNKLPAQIEATRKVVEDARSKLAKSEQGASAALMQSTLAANIATMELKPSADAIEWSGISIGSFVALLFAIAAPAFFFMAYRDGRTSKPSQSVTEDAITAKLAASADRVTGMMSGAVQKFDGITGQLRSIPVNFNVARAA